MTVLWVLALALTGASAVVGHYIRSAGVIWLGFWAGVTLTSALWYTVAR